MIENIGELQELNDKDKAVIFDKLCIYLNSCPIGWANNHLLYPRSFTEEDIINWFTKLQTMSAESFPDIKL
jgi:hypothetical protein